MEYGMDDSELLKMVEVLNRNQSLKNDKKRKVLMLPHYLNSSISIYSRDAISREETD